MEGNPILNRRLPSDSEAAALISALQASTAAAGVEEAFVLLSRWARQLSQQQQHSPGIVNITSSQQQTLKAAVNAGIRTLQTTSVSDVHGAAAAAAAAAVLLLGSASGALVAGNTSIAVEEIAEIVGTALLSAQPMQLENTNVVIDYLISGTATLLPTISYNTDAACWIFTALLSYLGNITIRENSSSASSGSRLAKGFVGLYLAMRTATTAIIISGGTSSIQQQQHPCLNSFYGALRAVLLPSSTSISTNSTSDLTRAAAATLAAGGMLEALARHQQQRPFPALIPLIEALAELLQHAAVANSSNSTIQQISTGIAIAQTYQACRLPRPTPATLHCCVGALLDTVLNIKPLLDTLKYTRNNTAGELSTALAQQDSWNHYATALQLTAASQFSQASLSPAQLGNVLEVIKNAARRTHEQYRHYILEFWTQERAQVDYRPLQSLLEKNFLISMELLASATSNGDFNGRMGNNALPASTVLCIIADLQFCRVTTSPHYSRLLKDALQSLPLHLPASSKTSTSPSAALSDLVGCLPAYQDLEIRIPAHGNTPAWLVDALSASKVQLLFTALTPCSRSLPEDLALDILAPLAFLYLLHPHPGTSTAAHTMLWSLMGTTAQHAEQLTPYYVIRCLEKVPLSSSASSLVSTSAAPIAAVVGTATPDQMQHLQNFSQGLSTALATAPSGSPLGLLAVEKILRVCLEMEGAGPCWDGFYVALFNVAVQQLLTVDYTRVDSISQQLHEFVLRSPVRVRGRLLEAVMAMVVGTEDCVRKPRLATWYQDLSATTVTANVSSL